MLRRARFVMLVPVVAAAACAGGPASSPTGGGAGRPTPDAAITISYYGAKDDRGKAQVVCASRRDEVRGFLRLEQPAELCRRLAELGGFLTAPPPRDRACAEVYGGPERARFVGRFAGRRVDRSFARTDGCEVKDWERVSVFLPRLR